MGKNLNWDRNKLNQRVAIESVISNNDKRFAKEEWSILATKANQLIKNSSPQELIDLFGSNYTTPMGPYNQVDQKVYCTHCQKEYNLSEMVFELRFEMDEPLWWCKYHSCNGAGLGYDIWKVD
jgi:hypothetical protein